MFIKNIIFVLFSVYFIQIKCFFIPRHYIKQNFISNMQIISDDIEDNTETMTELETESFESSTSVRVPLTNEERNEMIKQWKENDSKLNMTLGFFKRKQNLLSKIIEKKQKSILLSTNNKKKNEKEITSHDVYNHIQSIIPKISTDSTDLNYITNNIEIIQELLIKLIRIENNEKYLFASFQLYYNIYKVNSIMEANITIPIDWFINYINLCYCFDQDTSIIATKMMVS